MQLPSLYRSVFQLAMAGLLLVCLVVFSSPLRAAICPFCSAVALTFSEQIDSNDVVVVAKLLEVPPPSDDLDADFPKAKFEITRVIKGDKHVANEMTFRTQLVGNYPVGQKFLVMGVDPPRIAWSTPMKASDRVFQYLEDIQELPEKGPERLVFFQDYFEHEESILAFDAYDEYARAPYEDLIAMKDQMKRDKILGWIKDPDTSVNRRRLYFTMLGVCGQPEDIELLEDLIRSGDRKKRAGLDALIACYLNLKKADGVDLIEQEFMTNPDADYVDILAAVSALRFHGTEVDFIPKERIVVAIRHLLDRPKMADMIIPDLARWEDWSVMERLVQMFKDADDETNWLRVPVITYLRACPKPEAKTYIEELAKIDPDAVRRADFFLGGFDDDEGDEEEEEEEEGGDEQDKELEDANGEDDSSENSADLDQAATTDRTNSEQESADDNELSEGGPTDRETSEIRRSLEPAVDDSHVVLKAPVVLDSEPSPTTNVGDNASFGPLAASSPVPDSNPGEAPATFASNPADTVFVSSSSSMSQLETPGPEEVAQVLPESAPLATIASSRTMTWSIIFVPMGVSVVIFVLLWSVVNGWFERLIF